MSFQTLYIGISPFSGPSIYNIIPMIELIYGVWFIKGGMFQYAKALEKRFIELGGKIVYNSTVESLLTLKVKINLDGDSLHLFLIYSKIGCEA